MFIFCCLYFPDQKKDGVFDGSVTLAFYDIIKNKKTGVKKLITKTSKEFTLVINLLHQMLGLKGSR